MRTIRLDNRHIPLLEEFCSAASAAGFSNNESLRKMKFGGEFDLQTVPEFWGIVFNGKLISVSGCHLWPDHSSNTFTINRCLFRSATLPEFNNVVPGLSKTHMNSLPFSIMLPYQVEWGIKKGCWDHRITTSHGDHDASGKMKRTHRALELLEKQGIVSFFDQDILYSTPQTVWRLNLEPYLKALRAFHPTRVELDLDISDEYLKIINQGFSTV